MKPRLLDLFCGAGGAAMGYHRAGFEVVGIDHVEQPNYPFEFHRADALEHLGFLLMIDFDWAIDAIHASPPCQAFTAYSRTGNVGEHPDLIARTRELLGRAGLPYVIENVPGAPLCGAIQVCGTGLGLDVQRHRLFEASFPLMGVPCAHGRNAPRFPQATNRQNRRRTVEVGVWRIPLEEQQRAMGINWMTLEELSEAIPPVYTEHIGDYLLNHIRTQQKVAA